jgi:hypothetical protein
MILRPQWYFSLFPIPYSLFLVPCSLFPVPCSLPFNLFMSGQDCSEADTETTGKM